MILTNNFIVYGTKVLAELARDIVYFPLWWYGRGLIATSKGLLKFLNQRQKSLALLVWIKNIHRPMYGQRDWAGILISFFMRLFQIIVRSIAMFFWVIAVLALLSVWLILPFFIIYQVIFQLI